MRPIELTYEQKVEKLVTRLQNIHDIFKQPDYYFNNDLNLKMAKVAQEVFMGLGEIGISQGR